MMIVHQELNDDNVVIINVINIIVKNGDFLLCVINSILYF